MNHTRHFAVKDYYSAADLCALKFANGPSVWQLKYFCLSYMAYSMSALCKSQMSSRKIFQ